MKTFILRTGLFMALFFVLNNVKAQWVSIPDTAFVSYLQTNFPSCMNGNLMDTTCGAIVNAKSVDFSVRFHHTDITGIQFFDNLDTLTCTFDYLTSLPDLPSGLTFLDCHGNSLMSMPTLPSNLIYLDCARNQLMSLPALPNSLTTLYCSWNRLPSLPALPSSLTLLDCPKNKLTSLPALPSGLTAVNCYENLLTSLPALPSTLSYLVCNNNYLTSMPALPSSLTSLDCKINQLTTMPALPSNLMGLDCKHNQLTSLPELPDSLGYLSCYNNPNLTCLPRLKKIRNLDFGNTAITCLPNYPESNIVTNPPLNSVPLCDSSNNTNGCLVLDIQSAIQNPQFAISPNPATNSVTIAIDEDMLNSNLTVYDITGKKMTAVQLQTKNVKLQTDNLSQGIYFITIQTRTVRVTKKLVKQ